jgi:uncharacterized SAM-binding protein YcdF (DUF218 family)
VIPRTVGLARRLALVAIAVIAPFAIGLVRFAGTLPAPTDDPMRTDAIVVLTGGGDRVAAGLALLEAGKAKRLFVSGVHEGVGIPDLLKIDRAGSGAPPLEQALIERIDLGHEAGDTLGNAVESVAWMRLNRLHTLRLVTADYHMRRALIEFRMAGPDLSILPNPVRSAVGGRWLDDRAAFRLMLGEYAKYIVAKWRYLIGRAIDSHDGPTSQGVSTR